MIKKIKCMVKEEFLPFYCKGDTSSFSLLFCQFKKSCNPKSDFLRILFGGSYWVSICRVFFLDTSKLGQVALTRLLSLCYGER